jgi:lipopolysaccharide export LptBFGC system permease protein LptF
MVPIMVLTAAALFFGYSRRYPMDKLIGLGIGGFFAGFLVFGVQVALADQPKVPCWSESKGVEQLFRAMPFACQAAVQAR